MDNEIHSSNCEEHSTRRVVWNDDNDLSIAFAGVLIVLVIALSAGLVRMGEVVSQQHSTIVRLEEKQKEQTSQIENLEKRLLDFQEWRLDMALASRGGWAAVNKRIAENAHTYHVDDE